MKKILILHKTYTLLEPDYVSDVNDDPYYDDAQAYCDFYTKTIVVPFKNSEGEEIPKSYRIELLEHEIIHALLAEGGYDGESMAHDEKIVEMIRFISSYIRETGVLKCL